MLSLFGLVALARGGSLFATVVLLIAVVHVSAVMLAAYIAPAVSILTSLVTKVSAAAPVKAIVNLLLAGITAQVVAGIQAGGLTLDRTFWVAFGTTFALSVASYFGLWKPTGIDAKVASALPTKGIG